MTQQETIEMMERTEQRIKEYREMIKTKPWVRWELNDEKKLLKHIQAFYMHSFKSDNSLMEKLYD